MKQESETEERLHKHVGEVPVLHPQYQCTWVLTHDEGKFLGWVLGQNYVGTPQQTPDLSKMQSLLEVLLRTSLWLGLLKPSQAGFADFQLVVASRHNTDVARRDMVECK